MMDCTSILLIYNEEENIEPLTKKILDVYRKNEITGEVLLVDDGSYDGSKKVCDDMAARFENVRTIHHPKNLGRSYAIQTGFREGKGDVLIIMDCDCQYDPEEIPKFINEVCNGNEVVSGLRINRADDFIRRFISRIYNRLIIQQILKLKVKDQNSGFKAFKRDAAEKMEFNPDGFLGLHRFILPLASIKGYSIVEIPITHYDRSSGSSYIKFYTVPFITLRDMVKFKDRYL